jgi:tetratricopeptide (TPR) repeat protein
MWLLGDAERAIGLAERVLAIAETVDDQGLRIIARVRLGQAYHGLGRYGQAIDVLRAVISAVQGELRHEQYGMAAPPSVIARTWLAWCLAERGEFSEGQACAEEGLAIAESVHQPYTLVAASFGLGVLHLRRGIIDDAIRVLDRGLALCQVREVPVFLPWIAAALGFAYVLAGQVERGLPLLEQAVEPDTLTKAVHESFPFLWLGEAHLLAGRLDEAGDRARQALALARDRRERGHAAYALRLQAEIAARREPPDAAAEGVCRQAIAAAEELGMRPLEAQCRAGLGRLYRRMGRRNEGEAAAAAAMAAYRTMGMSL